MSLNQMIGNPGAFYSVNGNTYQADGTGLISRYTNTNGTFQGIATGDIVGLINEGALPANLRSQIVNLGAIKAASATVLVASVALTNAALTVAASPDVPRQAQAVVNPGTLAITAGALTLVYASSGGVAVTEALSLVTPLSTAKTLVTSRGVSTLTSATVSGLVGGAAPNIQIGTNGVIALPTDANQANITVYAASVDGVSDVLPAQSATDLHLITPNTAPNGTKSFSFGYNYYGA